MAETYTQNLKKKKKIVYREKIAYIHAIIFAIILKILNEHFPKNKKIKRCDNIDDGPEGCNGTAIFNLKKKKFFL
jgi:hypothetical protein